MIYSKIDDDPAGASEPGAIVDHNVSASQQHRAGAGQQGPESVAREQAMARRRKQTPIGEPLPLTFRWMARVPRSVQPLALFRQYPRITNMMAAMWQDPQSFRPYLHDLLADGRGRRKGFPPEIVRELVKLHVHYEGLYPAVVDAQGDADKQSQD